MNQSDDPSNDTRVAAESSSANTDSTSTESTKQSRRDFIIKSGKYAAYASPILLTVLAPKAGIYAQSA